MLQLKLRRYLSPHSQLQRPNLPAKYKGFTLRRRSRGGRGGKREGEGGEQRGAGGGPAADGGVHAVGGGDMVAKASAVGC